MSKTETQKIRFNLAVLRALECPAGKDRHYAHDLLTPGLTLCVTATGKKSYYWYRWHHGRPVRVLLGKFEVMSIEQARRLAAEKHVEANSGVDPGEAKRKRKDDGTLLDAFETFMESPSALTKQARSKRTLADYRKQWKMYLAGWGNRKLASISKQEVVALHKRIGTARIVDGKEVSKARPYQANRVMALLSAIYGMAATHGYAGANPAHGVERFREKANMRYLRDDERKKFMDALANDVNQTAADAIKILLYTGARRSTVQAMTWDEIDIDAAVWHISRIKGGERLDVSLSPPAVDLLRQRMKYRKDGCLWVFPSARAASGHIEEVKDVINRVTKLVGISHLRVHDLRHSLASLMVNNGVSLAAVQRQLGHKNMATTAKYSHADLSLARDGVDVAAKAMHADEPDKPAGFAEISKSLADMSPDQLKALAAMAKALGDEKKA